MPDNTPVWGTPYTEGDVTRAIEGLKGWKLSHYIFTSLIFLGAVAAGPLIVLAIIWFS